MKTPDSKGWASQSSTRGVCDGLAIRKRDKFHDTLWNWKPWERDKAPPTPSKRRLVLIALTEQD